MTLRKPKLTNPVGHSLHQQHSLLTWVFPASPSNIVSNLSYSLLNYKETFSFRRNANMWRFCLFQSLSVCRLSVCRVVYCGQTVQDMHIVCIEVE